MSNNKHAAASLKCFIPHLTHQPEQKTIRGTYTERG